MLSSTPLGEPESEDSQEGRNTDQYNDPSCADKAKPLGVTGVFFIVSMNTEQMSKINGLIDDGTLRTVVDSVFSFSEARKARQGRLRQCAREDCGEGS